MIQKVIDKIPATLIPFIDNVMDQQTLEGLYELEKNINDAMENTHVVMVNGNDWPFYKLAIQEYQSKLKTRIEFVINWKLAVLCDVPTNQFDYDF